MSNLWKHHGMTKHPLYACHKSMISRCYNSNDKAYKWYGARGISVSYTWRTDRDTFFKWALANGWAPGLQIDRIDNNDGYFPKNCRFVTPKVNQRNRSNGRVIEYLGQRKILIEWAEFFNVDRKVLARRLAKMSVNKAFSTLNQQFQDNTA